MSHNKYVWSSCCTHCTITSMSSLSLHATQTNLSCFNYQWQCLWWDAAVYSQFWETCPISPIFVRFLAAQLYDVVVWSTWARVSDTAVGKGFSSHNVIKQIGVTQWSLIISSLVAANVHSHGTARFVFILHFILTLREVAAHMIMKKSNEAGVSAFHSPLDGARDLLCILASTVEFSGLIIIIMWRTEPAVKELLEIRTTERSMLNPLNLSFMSLICLF